MTQPNKSLADLVREYVSWFGYPHDKDDGVVFRHLIKLLGGVADDARKQEAQEILARFDEMVTLTPRESERSDIITFRHWLRGRIG